MTHEPHERPLLDTVADAIDGALQAADEAGLYDEFDRFPAARQRVASELVDRLRAEGYELIPSENVEVVRTLDGRDVARLARATAERDEDDL